MENLVCDVQRVAIDGSDVAGPAVSMVRTAFGTTMLVFLWLIVGVPMLWGVFRTLREVEILFQ